MRDFLSISLESTFFSPPCCVAVIVQGASSSVGDCYCFLLQICDITSCVGFFRHFQDSAKILEQNDRPATSPANYQNCVYWLWHHTEQSQDQENPGGDQATPSWAQFWWKGKDQNIWSHQGNLRIHWGSPGFRSPITSTSVSSLSNFVVKCLFHINSDLDLSI